MGRCPLFYPLPENIKGCLENIWDTRRKGHSPRLPQNPTLREGICIRGTLCPIQPWVVSPGGDTDIEMCQRPTQWRPHSLPTLFLNCLQEALTQLDPTSPAGAPILAGHFISQFTPSIRAKLNKAKNGPQTPIQNLMKMAFKVLMPEKRQQNQPTKKHLQQKVALQTQALVAALQLAKLQP
jgi:hypothetical protein